MYTKLYIKEYKLAFQTISLNKNTEVLLLCHALEKGMGITNVKIGYGKEKAKRLLFLLKNNNEEINSYELNEAYSVLSAYINYQLSKDYDVSDIKEEFENLKLQNVCYLPAGYQVLDKTSLYPCNMDFKQFVQSRHSIRSFSSDEVTPKEMNEVIEMVTYAPSACNRQSGKIYYTFNNELNSKLSKLVPGNKSFYNEIPYYSVITSDRTCFGARTEAFQWYVNGGIFLSYFVLSLHSKNIGSCIFQYPLNYETDAELRTIFNIKPSEAIIAIVGYGKYKEQTKCISAARKTAKDISCCKNE